VCDMNFPAGGEVSKVYAAEHSQLAGRELPSSDAAPAAPGGGLRGAADLNNLRMADAFVGAEGASPLKS
jgi:hypothetical protein